MDLSKNLLVSIINNMRDFKIARDEHWYRIPFESVERFLNESWPPSFLAFYQTSAFGKNSFSINNYSKVINTKIVKRKELFPDEPLNEKSNRDYYKILIEPLNNLPKPILSRRWRRIVFIQSTWEKFIKAVEINDLFDGSVLEDKLWAEFKRLGIDIERQELVQIDNRFYFLDFAAHCMKGNLDIETDGDLWHHNPSAASQDNLRNNDLSSEGWQIIRFTSDQINEQLESYCIPHITHHINQFGGIKIDDYFSKRIENDGDYFQYNIFDI